MEQTPTKLEMFYEGKAKKLYSTPDPDLIIAYFKDDATAFNAKKRGTIEQKGVMNNQMSELLFTMLEKHGIPTHFVRRLNDRDMLCKRLDIVPVETVVRNIVAGSMAKRLGREEGAALPFPIVEYYYKSDPLDDPLILPEHALAFGWATQDELDQIKSMALKVNEVPASWMSAACCWSTSSSSSGAITGASCWATKFVPTPVASGTRPRARSWTRIASAATSAASKRPTKRCCAGSPTRCEICRRPRR
jgi:phosphoribosylaminoimidazole-succinocarboxamide synthase